MGGDRAGIQIEKKDVALLPTIRPDDVGYSTMKSLTWITGVVLESREFLDFATHNRMFTYIKNEMFSFSMEASDQGVAVSGKAPARFLVTGQ